MWPSDLTSEGVSVGIATQSLRPLTSTFEGIEGVEGVLTIAIEKLPTYLSLTHKNWMWAANPHDAFNPYETAGQKPSRSPKPFPTAPSGLHR